MVYGGQLFNPQVLYCKFQLGTKLGAVSMQWLTLIAAQTEIQPKMGLTSANHSGNITQNWGNGAVGLVTKYDQHFMFASIQL